MTNNKLIRKSLPYIIGVIIFLILSMVADSQIAKNQDSERLKVAGRYSAFQYELTSILDREVTLMKGIITLLSFKKMQISDEEIYGYIDSLITEQQKLIRNISILEDTTIRWAYPVESERGAIGIDLATVDGQKRGVLTVKENRVNYFQGPVNLQF
jgi:sensor domain CHASE-containing protein